MSTAKQHIAKPSRRMLMLQLVVGGLALAVLMPRLGEPVDGLAKLQSVNWPWLGLAIWAVLASYIAAGYVYLFLVRHLLPVWPLMTTQLASAFAGRILPGGLGNVTVNMRFLTKAGLTLPEATLIAVSNQLIGFLSFGLLLMITSWQQGRNLLEQLTGFFAWWYVLVPVCIVLSCFYIVSLLTKSYRGRLRTFVAALLTSFKKLLQHPVRFAAAVGASIGVSLAHGLALQVCMLALGVQVGYGLALFVYIAGASIASAAPTPGGLGAVEAALLAGLAAMNVSLSDALAVIVLYRLLTFWLPILPGYAAFRWLMAKQYI